MRREDKGQLELEAAERLPRRPLDEGCEPAITALRQFSHHDVERVIGVGSKHRRRGSPQAN